MKETKILLCGMAGLSLFCTAVLGAETGEPPADRPTTATAPATPEDAAIQSVTALIDMKYLLKHHVGLTRRLADLRQAQVDFGKEMAEKRQAIAAYEDALERYKPESKEYASLLENVVKGRAELNALVELRRGKFRRGESRLRFQAYQQIQQEIGYYFGEGVPEVRPRPHVSRARVVVLNSNRREPDAIDPDSIRRTLGQHVVYQKNLDITSSIQERIDRAMGGELDYEQEVKRLDALERELVELTAEKAEEPVDEWDQLWDEWFPPPSKIVFEMQFGRR